MSEPSLRDIIREELTARDAERQSAARAVYLLFKRAILGIFVVLDERHGVKGK